MSLAMKLFGKTKGRGNWYEIFKLECQESLKGRFIGNIGKRIADVNGNTRI
jgi:hypothetical protein